MQNTEFRLEASTESIASQWMPLFAVTPEDISESNVIDGMFRVQGPDANDWFRLSINADAIAASVLQNKSIEWDTVKFRDVSGEGFSIYISEAKVMPAVTPDVAIESWGDHSCIGTSCNPALAEAFSTSSMVPLLGFGPLQESIGSGSTAGMRTISMIAKLSPTVTKGQVVEFCAGLQGQSGNEAMEVFVRSQELLETRSSPSDDVAATCVLDYDDVITAMTAPDSQVEWPFLTIETYSVDNVTTVREYAVGVAQYLDRNGIAQAWQEANTDEFLLPDAKASCPGLPWGLSRIDQPNLPLDKTYNPPGTGNGVHIYVLDTGVNPHSDFQGRLGEGVNCVNGGCKSGSTNDAQGHGTHVAGTAAGTCYGVAKRAIINPVKVLGDNGSGSYSGIISGIRWATDNAKANKWRGVINMSLGGGSSSSLNAAVQTAVSQGMVVAAAAGNDRAANACTKSPASAPPALTVASVTSRDTASSFSNVGSCVDIWAPGDRIASANSADYNGYRFLSGTSMAAPHVAGAAAIVLERNSRASPDQVAQALARVSVKRNLYPGTTQNLLQVRGL